MDIDGRQLGRAQAIQQRPFGARLHEPGVTFVGGLDACNSRVTGFGECIGRGPQQLPVAAQVGRVQAELGNAAVHNRGRRLDVAMGVGQLSQLPEKSPVGREPQGQLLRQRRRIGRQFLAFGGRQLARLELT